MTTFQKIVKYLALAFAIFIIVNIIYGILFGVYALGLALGYIHEDRNEQIEAMDGIVQLDNTKVANLEINLKYSNLEIKKGDYLLAETNNKNISCKQNGDKILIEESNYNWFSGNKQGKIIVYIPEDFVFETVEIETGAGQINIEQINSDKLSLEIGAGKVEIQNLIVNSKTKIEGGAGKVDILAGKINNLKLDMGVGKFTMSTKLIGDSKINAGIGALEIGLIDEEENYTIKAEKGIGTIKINGKEIANDTRYGTGENYIEIDGGIGNIDITTK